MELDKRIIEGKRPLTCLDIEQAREFVGKECIFSDSYDNYRDIEKYNIDNNNDYTAILSRIDDDTSNGDYVFNNPKIKARYRLILPLEWVKEPEKKYRPFTDVEFIEKFEFKLGYVIRLRVKDADSLCHTAYEYKTVFTGYRQCSEGIEVFLNDKWYTMDTLFGSLEYMEDDEWKPFGVEVKGEK